MSFQRVVVSITKLSDLVSALNDPVVLASIQKLPQKDQESIYMSIEKMCRSISDFQHYLNTRNVQPFMEDWFFS